MFDHRVLTPKDLLLFKPCLLQRTPCWESDVCQARDGRSPTKRMQARRMRNNLADASYNDFEAGYLRLTEYLCSTKYVVWNPTGPLSIYR